VLKNPNVLSHPVVKALLLHAGVFLLLFANWRLPTDPIVLQPHINVSLVKSADVKKTSAQKPKPPAETVKKEVKEKVNEVKPQEEKKIVEQKVKEQEIQQKLILKQKQIEKEKLEKQQQKKLAEEKAQKEKAQKEKEKKQKALEDKKQLEKQRATELDKMRKKEAQRLKELEALRAQENQRMDNASSSADQDVVNQYIGAIQEQIQRTWSRPPSARKGMQVTLKIRLIPGGEVVSVSILESSGNAAFDRSAEQAVNRAGKLPVPPDAKIFDRHFRTLELIFRPEDL